MWWGRNKAFWEQGEGKHMEEGQENKDQVKAIRAEQTVTVERRQHQEVHDKQEHNPEPGEKRSHVCSHRPTEEVAAMLD